MVDMKGAVRAAMVFAKDLLPEVKDIRLEEVELRQGHYENSASEGRIFKQDPFWRVVVSFATNAPATYAIVTGNELPRVYKTIAIDPETGQGTSLKVWNQ